MGARPVGVDGCPDQGLVGDGRGRSGARPDARGLHSGRARDSWTDQTPCVPARASITRYRITAEATKAKASHSHQGLRGDGLPGSWSMHPPSATDSVTFIEARSGEIPHRAGLLKRREIRGRSRAEAEPANARSPLSVRCGIGAEARFPLSPPPRLRSSGTPCPACVTTWERPDLWLCGRWVSAA